MAQTAYSFSAVTPSDSVNIVSGPADALWVGTGGDVAIRSVQGEVVTFKNVPGGTMLLVQTSRVNLTGTTATDIVALLA
jgi:hypothetical protein